MSASARIPKCAPPRAQISAVLLTYALSLLVLIGCVNPSSKTAMSISNSRPAPYANETVALSVVTPRMAQPASSSPSASNYANETLALSFDIIPLPQTIDKIPTMTWPEAKPLLVAGKLLLLDVRPPAEYRRGHVPGAISLPAETPDADLQLAMSQYAKDQPIATYCASIECAVSRAFAQRLLTFGFANVIDIPGGFAEYLRPESPPAK